MQNLSAFQLYDFIWLYHRHQFLSMCICRLHCVWLLFQWMFHLVLAFFNSKVKYEIRNDLKRTWTAKNPIWCVIYMDAIDFWFVVLSNWVNDDSDNDKIHRIQCNRWRKKEVHKKWIKVEKMSWVMRSFFCVNIKLFRIVTETLSKIFESNDGFLDEFQREKKTVYSFLWMRLFSVDFLFIFIFFRMMRNGWSHCSMLIHTIKPNDRHSMRGGRKWNSLVTK